MSTDKFFYEIPVLSSVANNMYNLASTTPNDRWIDYYSFKAIPVPINYMVDSWWRKLYDLHPFKAGILRMEENSYYDWHVDTNRGVGLNLLLNNWDASHCLFDGNPNTRNKKQLSKDAIEEHDLLDEFRVTSKFTELKYKPNTYYLFNVQEAHSVYNFSGTRYLLTLEFFKNKDELNYNQLVEEIKQGKWIEQQLKKEQNDT